MSLRVIVDMYYGEEDDVVVVVVVSLPPSVEDNAVELRVVVDDGKDDEEGEGEGEEDVRHAFG